MIKQKKRRAQRTSSPGLPHPYLNAKRTWNSHVGSLIASRTLWQAVALISLLVAFAAVGGVVYIGSQSKFVPYVVEVNKLGEAMAVAPASQAAKVDQRIVRASVAEYIVNARTVTPDIAMQRRAIFKVYALMNPGSAATRKMTAYLNGNPETNPFKRAEKQTVNVEIVSAIPQTSATWQVDWIETQRTRKGEVMGKPYRMRAMLNVSSHPMAPDATDDQIRLNPMGVYVSDYSWTKQF
ncbi:VirB8/TrbF family protein [Luteibacter sp. 329MFSha]|uniref:VirB8/TrbF family protein n=1 Tax=Luteibacter sp. 329MFSha TaxID=1798239 RepID=UPI0008B19FE5|nr:VirB8/TrbF family protein [Luteibacter sp. 329MFSha]SEW28493.1 type IV secretion system protein VirB5 [Luteibacter sp. 329MFSha]